MTANAGNRKKTNARQQAKNRRKMIIFGVELAIIVIMVGVLIWVMDFTEEQPHVTEEFAKEDVNGVAPANPNASQSSGSYSLPDAFKTWLKENTLNPAVYTNQENISDLLDYLDKLQVDYTVYGVSREDDSLPENFMDWLKANTFDPDTYNAREIVALLDYLDERGESDIYENYGVVREEAVKAAEADEGPRLGYTNNDYINIALFGVDARNENELYKSSRSDTIMIASINKKTGDIKLVSVYRDTYLNLGNDSYKKCNAAYAKGGAKQAVGMLNMNLDMDITQFVTVGYAGLAEVIDGLGGVWIDVDEDEMKHINNYQYSIIGKYAKKYLGDIPSELNFTPDDYFKDYTVTVVKQPGMQLLNGLQAAAYCRIRYVGNDFQRTARQREVIKAIESQAKQASLSTLTKVFESAVDDIYTNLDTATILTELLPNIANYRIVDESGFPEMDMQENVSMGANGSCQIPLDLSSSVSWLHGFLFGDENYEASDIVSEITKKIRTDVSKYRGN